MRVAVIGTEATAFQAVESGTAAPVSATLFAAMKPYLAGAPQ